MVEFYTPGWLFVVWGDLPHVLHIISSRDQILLRSFLLKRILRVPRLKANLILYLVLDYSHSGHILALVHT